MCSISPIASETMLLNQAENHQKEKFKTTYLRIWWLEYLLGGQWYGFISFQTEKGIEPGFPTSSECSTSLGKRRSTTCSFSSYVNLVLCFHCFFEISTWLKHSILGQKCLLTQTKLWICTILHVSTDTCLLHI